MPSMSTFPEVPGGMLIHYSPLNELPRIHAHRPHTTGLVAARVQRFEAGDAPPPSPKPVATPTLPNSPTYPPGDTKQEIKVMLHYAGLISVSNPLVQKKIAVDFLCKKISGNLKKLINVLNVATSK